MGKYRGDGCVSRILREIRDPLTCIRVKMEPFRLHFFTKIMEAYCHLVFISPLDAREGVAGLYATPDNMPLVRTIVENFPYPVEIIE